MTFERYIAVSQPLRASQICTIKRARYTLTFVALIFFLINVHFLWTFHLSFNQSHCIPWNEQSIFLKYFTWFDSFKYSFCPFTLLITLNIFIIKSLLNARNANKFLEQQTSIEKEKNVQSKSSSISSSSTSTSQSGNILTKKSPFPYPSSKALAYRRVNRRLTTMLLTVSFAFCICSMPISIMQLIDAIYSDIEQRSKTMNIYITIGKIIAEISQYLNHCKNKKNIILFSLEKSFSFLCLASNFFLYAFTGRIFRHELHRLFTCHRYRFFSSSSSQRLKHRAKKIIAYQNPNEGVHEHFYSHGKCYTRILIAPKHFLSIPQDQTYRPSISSTYSLSQFTLTQAPTLHHTKSPLPTNAVHRKSTLLSLMVDQMQNDPTASLLSSSIIHPDR